MEKTGSPVVAIKSADLVVLVASAQYYQIQQIDEFTAFSYAGNQPHANEFYMNLVEETIKYKLMYSAKCPLTRLVNQLCKKIQIRTQRYDRVPYKVEILLTGHDESGLHIYHIDSSGNFYECNAMVIGSGSELACRYLETLPLTDSEGLLCSREELNSHCIQAILHASSNLKNILKATIGKTKSPTFRVIEIELCDEQIDDGTLRRRDNVIFLSADTYVKPASWLF